MIEYYNTYDVSNESNYMSENFAGTYFDLYNSQKICFIRDDIERRFHSKEVNEKERAMVITSLMNDIYMPTTNKCAFVHGH